MKTSQVLQMLSRSLSYCLSLSLSVSLCLSLSLSVSPCLSVYLTVSLCLSHCPSLSLSVYLCLSVSLSLCLPLSLSASPSLSVARSVLLGRCFSEHLTCVLRRARSSFECGVMRVLGRVGDDTSLYVSPALVVVSPGAWLWA